MGRRDRARASPSGDLMASYLQTVMVRLQPEVKAQLRAYAGRQGRSMSSVIASLVAAEMKMVAGLEAESDRQAQLVLEHVATEEE